jgi:hypothetical protein
MSMRDDTSRHRGVGPHRRRPLWLIVASVLVAVVAVTAVAMHRSARADGWHSLRELRVTSDEGYVYLLLQTEATDDSPDWNSLLYRIAIDTYDPQRGERELPPPHPAALRSGAEFLIEIAGPGRSAVLVTPTYDPYPGGVMVEGRPVVSPQKPAGSFEPLIFESNRERFARDGRRFPALRVARGVLRFLGGGEAAATTARADIAIGTGALEMRIPWSLLNVADPSTRRVLHGRASAENAPTVETPGFRFYVFSFDRSKGGADAVDRLPERWSDAPLYEWARWNEPKRRLEPKAGTTVLAETMKSLSEVPPGP